MHHEKGKRKHTERRQRAMTLLSRRDFLSSVAVASAAAVAPRALPSAMAAPQASVTSPMRAVLPPPAGQEASYQWYLGQYTDPTMFTAIGLPGDPAETAVSPNGELVYANDIVIQGSKYESPSSPERRIRETRWHLRYMRRARLCPWAQGSPRGSPWQTVTCPLL